MRRATIVASLAALFSIVAGSKPALADGNLQRVNHIVIVMQENHSFDNYFGVLAYAPGSPLPQRKRRVLGNGSYLRGWLKVQLQRVGRPYMHKFESGQQRQHGLGFSQSDPLRSSRPRSLLGWYPPR